MNFLFLTIFKIVLGLGVTVHAYVPEEGNVLFGYSLNIYKTQFPGSANLPSSPLMAGFGIVATGDLNTSNSIEVGISHLSKIFYRENAGRYLAEQTSLVQVNIGYRKWIFEKLNVGLSLASGYPFGGHTIVHAESGVEIDSSTTAREINQNSGELSFQFELWSDQKNYWVTDIYWSHSFSAKSDEKAHHAGIIFTYKSIVRDNKSTPQTTNPAEVGSPEDFVQ